MNLPQSVRRSDIWLKIEENFVHFLPSYNINIYSIIIIVIMLIIKRNNWNGYRCYQGLGQQGSSNQHERLFKCVVE